MIKTVIFTSRRLYPYTNDDCVVLQRTTSEIRMAFPFHEDTPNFELSISEAMNLRWALDELLCIKQLTSGGND